jgi:sulfoxide reductase catalytic subunit YedY
MRYDIKESQVTPENVFLERRTLLKGMGFIGAGTLLANSFQAHAIDWFSNKKSQPFETKPLSFNTDENLSKQILTPEAKVISHNNFYEFGAQKKSTS